MYLLQVYTPTQVKDVISLYLQCILTLYTYIVYLHYILTLYTYTIYLHCILTVYTYSVY